MALKILAESAPTSRRRELAAFKRQAIRTAAARVFTRDGAKGATMRAIAAQAGYSLGAIYLHYPSKDAIQAELAAQALADLGRAVRDAITAAPPGDRPRAAARAFYRHGHDRQDSLGLILRLGRGGGIDTARERLINGRLIACLAPISAAIAEHCRLGTPEANLATVRLVAGLIGVLLLEATGRLDVLGQAPGTLVDRMVDDLL